MCVISSTLSTDSPALQDVCKYHLLGLCPYSLFSNTKSDLGEHLNGEEDDNDMAAEFKKLSENEQASYGYEKSLKRFLEDLVAGCDRKVSRNKERCEQENPANSIDDRKVARLMDIEEAIASKTAESEAKAEEGELDESQELLEQVETLRAEKKEIEYAVAQGRTTTKRNIVCEVSESCERWNCSVLCNSIRKRSMDFSSSSF